MSTQTRPNLKPVRFLFLAGVTLFWIVMTSLLIRREYFEFTPVQDLHQVLSFEYLKFRQEYRGVYLGKDRIGFNFIALDPIEKSENSMYEMRHMTYLSFLFLGQEREMLFKGKATLDKNLTVQDFEVKISSGDYWTKIAGQTSKNNLNLVIEGKQGEPVRRILPIQGPLYYSESLDFLWTPENLKINKKGKVQIFNPLMMNFQPITFHVANKTRIPYEGEEKTVYVAHLDLGGLETRAWISQEGIVLKEESPSGLLIKKEQAWEIFDAMRKRRSTLVDLPNLFSIASNQILTDTERLRSLKVQVKTGNAEKVYEIHKEDLNTIGSLPLPVSADPEHAAFLSANDWVQSDDPVIKQKASEILGGEKDALRASLKLLKWTHENVSPVPTVAFPQARQVLATGKGDCNEYTVLFTALARASGIPTKMVAGLVYQNGRFFYHAWPLVYLGRWIGVDPTFGQAPVDVTHIPLNEGDIQEQIALANQIGRIKLIILEAK